MEFLSVPEKMSWIFEAEERVCVLVMNFLAIIGFLKSEEQTWVPGGWIIIYRLDSPSLPVSFLVSI